MNFCNPSRSDSSITSSTRPLPLKQRTSSKDTRKDYTHYTWTSLLVLLNIREFFVTVDNFSIWRRHLAWAMESGKDLKTYMTQRYASNMVFMSLLLSTELGVLFNSAQVTTEVRDQLRNGQHWSFSFWAGLMILISALLTILSLISTFTAWAMVNSVNANNAHCVFRSSIGQYAAELPGRLIVCSIYSFLVSFIIYFFLLLPVGIWSILLLVSTSFLFVHIVSVFSALGRVIMHTGAMGDERIFTPDFEEQLLPQTLHSNLLAKSKANLENNTSIVRQYRRKQIPIDRFLTEEQLYEHLCGRLEAPLAGDIPNANRARVDSTVRFADEEHGRSSKTSSHVRNMTPLSDISSPSASPNGFAGASKPPGKSPYPPAGSMRRTKYSTTPLVPLNVPKPENFDPQAIRNVSSSSLEQWLQSSPRGSTSGSFSEPDVTANDISSPSASPNGFVGASKPSGKSPYPPAGSMRRTKYSTTPLVPLNVSKPENFDPQAIRNVSSSSLEQWLQSSPRGSTSGSFSEPDVTANGGQSPPPPPIQQSSPKYTISRPQTSNERMRSSMSSISSTKSYNEMTDDERFALEYGEFGDNNHSNDGDADNVGDEKASLLRNNRQFHDYGNSGRT